MPKNILQSRAYKILKIGTCLENKNISNYIRVRAWFVDDSLIVLPRN